MKNRSGNMLNEKLENKFNEQINAEIFSAC